MSRLETFLVVFALTFFQVTGFRFNSLETATTERPSYSIPERLPFIVSLKQQSWYDDTRYSHFCTGSILSKDWVLTAGHCFTKKDDDEIDRLVVDVGSENLNSGIHYPIAEYHVHPNESESIEIYKNDLCLVRLKNPIKFNASVQPSHLGTIKDQEEVQVLAGGWGKDLQRGIIPKKVRLLPLKTMRFDECRKIHSRRNNLIDTETHICGFGGIGRTLCFGNSGGPLIDLKTGYQVGVFSSLEDCTGEFPVLFMRVESFIDWIRSVTQLELKLD